MTRLLRAATGVADLDDADARAQVRARAPDAAPDDLLGIADPEAELPKIDPKARRRRLAALLNAASLTRRPRRSMSSSSVSMLSEFVTVIPQTPSLLLVTYRPEYRGALSRVAGAHTIVVAPLSDAETAALVSELLGPHLSVGKFGQTITDRAAGNP